MTMSSTSCSQWRGWGFVVSWVRDGGVIYNVKKKFLWGPLQVGAPPPPLANPLVEVLTF